MASDTDFKNRKKVFDASPEFNPELLPKVLQSGGGVTAVRNISDFDEKLDILGKSHGKFKQVNVEELEGADSKKQVIFTSDEGITSAEIIDSFKGTINKQRTPRILALPTEITPELAKTLIDKAREYVETTNDATGRSDSLYILKTPIQEWERIVIKGETEKQMLGILGETKKAISAKLGTDVDLPDVVEYCNDKAHKADPACRQYNEAIQNGIVIENPLFSKSKIKQKYHNIARIFNNITNRETPKLPPEISPTEAEELRYITITGIKPDFLTTKFQETNIHGKDQFKLVFKGIAEIKDENRPALAGDGRTVQFGKRTVDLNKQIKFLNYDEEHPNAEQIDRRVQNMNIIRIIEDAQPNVPDDAYPKDYVNGEGYGEGKTQRYSAEVQFPYIAPPKMPERLKGLIKKENTFADEFAAEELKLQTSIVKAETKLQEAEKKYADGEIGEEELKTERDKTDKSIKNARARIDKNEKAIVGDYEKYMTQLRLFEYQSDLMNQSRCPSDSIEVIRKKSKSFAITPPQKICTVDGKGIKNGQEVEGVYLNAEERKQQLEDAKANGTIDQLLSGEYGKYVGCNTNTEIDYLKSLDADDKVISDKAKEIFIKAANGEVLTPEEEIIEKNFKIKSISLVDLIHLYDSKTDNFAGEYRRKTKGIPDKAKIQRMQKDISEFESIYDGLGDFSTFVGNARASEIKKKIMEKFGVIDDEELKTKKISIPSRGKYKGKVTYKVPMMFQVRSTGDDRFCKSAKNIIPNINIDDELNVEYKVRDRKKTRLLINDPSLSGIDKIEMSPAHPVEEPKKSKSVVSPFNILEDMAKPEIDELMKKDDSTYKEFSKLKLPMGERVELWNKYKESKPSP